MQILPCDGHHGACGGFYARCECGWSAEYGTEATARWYASVHEKEAHGEATRTD
jgi:hypothetical protein